MYNDISSAEKNFVSELGKFDKFARWMLEDWSVNGQYPLYTGGKFYFYNGTHYERCDELPMRVREYLKDHRLGQSNNLVGNVVPVLESLAWRDAGRWGQMPFWFGPDSPFSAPGNVVAFRNGLLDVARYVRGDESLTKHNPKWCSPVCLPFAFDPAAACPRWGRFLDEVFEGDRERADLLAEFVGYTFTPDISHQKALMMCGESRSGKGTIAGVVRGLLGPGYTGFSLPSLVSAHGPTQLRGKLAAVVGEVELANDPNRAKVVEMLKAVVGGDEIAMNEKHNPLISSERVSARFVVCCNRKPSLFDASGALLNRMLVLPFDVSFAGREDTDLERKLAAELPGICNWALAGLKRLRERGRFTVGKASAAAAEEFGAKSAPVRTFVKQRLGVHPSVNPGDLPAECLDPQAAWTSTERLYAAFSGWCEEQGEACQRQEYFGQDLRDVLRKSKRVQRREHGQPRWGYTGVLLKPATKAVG